MSIFRRYVHIYYVKRRKILPAIFVPGILPAVSKVHPSRNPRLRDKTFRPPFLDYYQPKHILPIATEPDVSFIAVSKVHPSRNLRLRDTTFRPPFLDYYEPKREFYPSVFVAGILILVSRAHPSRNMRLRDSTFRPPYLDYYQPQRVIVVAETEALNEILFKRMWYRMYKKMR